MITTEIARRFRHFAEVECHGSSPLYESLALRISEDEELLALAANCAPGQPAPNLLFAAVHYLLLKESTLSPLRACYSDLTTNSGPGNETFPAFRDFCQANRAEIVDLLRTRLVQTNEVRRCAVLLPAFRQVQKEARDKPLALIEIGTSAGLNLLGDRYRYEYRREGAMLREIGSKEPAVVIVSEWRGETAPPSPGDFPAIGWRVGIDLNPIDIEDNDAVAWLRALIWPEHKERTALLNAAVSAARTAPPRLLRGDAVRLLPSVLEEAPTNAGLCVFHSHTVNQFPTAAKEELQSQLREASRIRPIWRVSLEGDPREKAPIVTLMRYESGEQTASDRLAFYDAHGRWMEWVAD